MSAGASGGGKRWARAWPDALAFAAGLAIAGWLGWDTADLVWSLWLASLVVGYAMIGWGGFSPAALAVREGRKGDLAHAVASGSAMLLFFTVHFGGFHWAQAGILNTFFPLDGSGDFPGWPLLGEAVRRYGWFVPVAALAERRMFRWRPMPPEPPRTSVKAADIAVRKARQAYGWVEVMTPYKNVVRMHLVLIFFAAAHALKLESFGVYAGVYAVYFFPWRLLARPAEVAEGRDAGK